MQNAGLDEAQAGIKIAGRQQSHCWAYTLRKLEEKETRVPQCSQQHCSTVYNSQDMEAT